MRTRWTDQIAVLSPTHQAGTHFIDRVLREEPETFLGLDPVLITLSNQAARGRRFAHFVEDPYLSDPIWDPFSVTRLRDEVYVGWLTHLLRGN